MNRIFSKIMYAVLIIASIGSMQACTRIATGEVGVRVNASNEVQPGELLPGSWNQTFWGSVLTFPVRDVAINIDDKHPLTADNTTLADFDLTVVYSINPASVSELYSDKSKSFNAYNEKEGDTYLMYNYIGTLVNNALNKAVRKYGSLVVADNRIAIEEEIRNTVTAQLHAEKLEAITLSVVQVRNVTPSPEILESATRAVKAENDLKVKTTEVQIAKQEALRMAELAVNSKQSIAYMQAQSQLLVAQGVKDCHINTVLYPFDFKGMINVSAAPEPQPQQVAPKK